MKESEYINITNLQKMRIIHSLAHDLLESEGLSETRIIDLRKMVSRNLDTLFKSVIIDEKIENAATVLKDFLIESGLPLCDDFYEQINQWEKYCDELVDVPDCVHTFIQGVCMHCQKDIGKI